MDSPVDRRLLPHTFGPWFGRFENLREIQRRAIPAILHRRDALLCSATASGKTEAYAAPAAEIAIAAGRPSAAVVVVCPTRALANDLKRRLEGPMQLVELSFGRYTGEHKERVAGHFPSVVVTTPEALDSILARRAALLRALQVVVVDEIHVLDGTPRGDHLRLLLQRLDFAAGRAVQRVAASATVEAPETLAARYLRDAAIAVVPGARTILGRAFAGSSNAAMALHLDELAEAGFKKLLVFCNARNAVERYAAALPGATRFGEHVYAHHGSLAKIRRERTERLFQSAPVGVCFATLTLEMGIDIGTVDYVLLASPPSSVAGLLQRIGRGGRRGDTTRAGYCASDAGEEFLFRKLFELGKAGQLCAPPYAFRLSTLAQQALVLAAAQGYLERSELAAIVPPALAREIDAEVLVGVLDALVEAELLERSGARRWVPTEQTELRYERGTLHSNIDDNPGIEVVDRMTGDSLGHVDQVPGRKFGIGGSRRDFAGEVAGRYLTDASDSAEPARFLPRAAAVISLRLARAVVEGLGLAPQELLLARGSQSWLLLHGLGTAGFELLQALLREQRSIPVLRANPYVLHLGKPLEMLPAIDEDFYARFLDERAPKLEELAQPGPLARHLPTELRWDFVRRALGFDEVLRFLENASLRRLAEPTAELLAIAETL
ncbi:MAG: DEAD/DEAH box helicase [Planctomycetes bacterium]|nr:DEAD/DEAH box helicase [Planctomycetota bacterium]